MRSLAGCAISECARVRRAHLCLHAHERCVLVGAEHVGILKLEQEKILDD